MSPSAHRFQPPEKLSTDHDLSHFQCGEPALDDWLRRRALQNEESGASRTYVLCVGNRVVGYYALAVGAVAHAEAPGRVRRNMPDPLPVMVIGRLALDQTMQGQSIGAALLRDAVLRTVQAAEIAGIRANPGARDLRPRQKLLREVRVHSFSPRPDDSHDNGGRGAESTRSQLRGPV